MNNILYYTISNLTEDSINCIHLLFSSLNNKIANLNFRIIVSNLYNKSNIKKLNHLEDNIIFVNQKYYNKHIFCLKYDSKIFNTSYDYYCYLDSDILFFLTPGCFNKNFNYFAYDRHPLNHKFFCASWPKYNISLDQQGINAGFFGASTNIWMQLSEFMKKHLFNRTRIKRTLWVEQSMFNYFVYSNKENWIDYSDNVCLFANDRTQIIDNKIYHFCDKIGQMDTKYNMMKKCLEHNNISL